MEKATARMMREIDCILNHNTHSAWLYGSVVLDDFQLGWSDIDFVYLTESPITERQARELLMLRQVLAEAEPENPYYRLFEGVMVDYNGYFSGSFERLIYWGTSGQRITDRYSPDVFSRYELAHYGRRLLGTADKSIFVSPERSELIAAVRKHYDAIRRYVTSTDESLYSCGWLLDISRCIYTLRYNEVISKTHAGFWALEKHIFADESPLRRTLDIRRDPLAYKDRDDVRQWLATLAPVVQQYADVLERELDVLSVF
ncbi:MAG: DNA polymerase subunit beta [Clostridia bacterium]|nr:DNA polymerase subunit beta [Clostridia bacterium]